MFPLSTKFPACIWYAAAKFSGRQRISLSTNFNHGKICLGKICKSPWANALGLSQIFPQLRGCYYFVILWSPRKTLRILPTGNLLFNGKQRISLSTNFPVHVNEGKLVDKEILCLPLNLPLAYHMHAGNVEDKGKIPSCMEQWGKYDVYILSKNKRVRGDHSITLHIICISKLINNSQS